MDDKAKIAALEGELEQRTRSILFLVAEYISQNETQRSKIALFLAEMIPQMPEGAAGVAKEVLDAVQRP